MRHVKIVMLTLFAVWALAGLVVASAAAQGLPTASPTNKENTTDDISLTAPTYVLTNGNKLVCETSSTGTSKETGSPAGKGEFHATFKGCTGELSGIKAKCTGLGDANTGEILSLGEYHLVYDTGGTELGVAILSLVASTHFTCAGLFLNVVSGELVCLVKEPYVSKSLHEGVCEQSKGVQKETWLNDSGASITPKLVVTEGEEGKPGAAVEGKALGLTLNAKKESTSTVTVMN